MEYIQEQVKELTAQLHALRASSMHVQQEIEKIAQQLGSLQRQLDRPAGNTPEPATLSALAEAPVRPVTIRATAMEPNKRITRSLEYFVGTNLISKIGILITISGIFIGGKYAIDNELISPLMRMVAGYVCAGLLAGVGLWLKAKYEQFSAVLVGGGIAVAYFITYTAYSFYGLYSQTGAFILMLLTTVAAVALALWYNQKIIALLGQVAAYAIPLLLSNGSGKVEILFTYIAIINAGLIVLSFLKDWKILYRLAFGITWCMYVYWLFMQNGKGLFYPGTMAFLTLHFLTFYCTFLSYKIFKKELYQLGEMVVLLVNALLYFLVGLYVVDHYFKTVGVRTSFAVVNAAIHFVAGYGIYKARLADRSVEQFLAGLGLLFISVAIPIRLDGSWVTLLWAIETVILVVIAIKNKRMLYFEMALFLMAVALLSMWQDWLFFDRANGLASRYFGMGGIALAWIALSRGRAFFSPGKGKAGASVFSAAFNITLLSSICNEYLLRLDIAGAHSPYKLGLTLICGSYALVILLLGLIKDNKHWRVGAIGLFALTIGKLLAYDLASLSTISKTVVMIGLGILLLLASYLYNKYKAVLAGKESDRETEQNEQGH